jgi:uncharacterized membrane protein
MTAVESIPVESSPKPAARGLNNRDSGGRLTFLDWTRGLAVVIILQGHVFDSFAKADLRDDGPFVLSQFLGGIGPAVFLVLTGVTLAFLMDRREKQGLPALDRWKAALRRAGYLYGLAILFRIQLWLFGYPQSPFTELFKVDILNCMGLAIAAMSVMAIFTTAERIRLCAVLGALIAGASPVISSLDWSWMAPQISAYFVPSYKYFAFFPWAAFIAFGMSIGSILRVAKAEQMNRIMQWGALLGFGLILGGQYFSGLPYSLYPKSEFWLDSPGLIVIKLGVVLLMLAFAFVWTEFAVGNSFSWVRQFGTTSLIVYWVHIELVYGRWFGPWKTNLNNWQCAVYAVVLIACMLLISIGRTRWNKVRLADVLRAYLTVNSPRRVSGD